jgi:glycosyltransferase involved in cell wall biosynthesis
VATALSQTYCNTEVIVCDDGSTDDTETQLEHFGSKITVIRQVCRGPAAALNTAIQHSHGLHIAPLLASASHPKDGRF